MIRTSSGCDVLQQAMKTISLKSNNHYCCNTKHNPANVPVLDHRSLTSRFSVQKLELFFFEIRAKKYYWKFYRLQSRLRLSSDGTWWIRSRLKNPQLCFAKLICTLNVRSTYLLCWMFFWIRRNGFLFHQSRAHLEAIFNFEPVTLVIFGFIQATN